MLTLKGAKGIIRRTADEQRDVSYMDYGAFVFVFVDQRLYAVIRHG